MTLDINKYKNMCIKDKWISKSHKEQNIVALSIEIENMKDTNLKLTNVFKTKLTSKVNTNNRVNQKSDKKSPQKQKNDNKYTQNKIPRKQGKTTWKNEQQELQLV